MYVLSIDIGIIHLGLSITLLNDDYSLNEIIWVDMIDITRYRHVYGPSYEDCKLPHTRNISDWIEHIIQENRVFFEEASVILLERQPPGTFVAIEQLIFSKYRSKTILISPRNVHSYLNITNLSYENRKKYVTEKALSHLSDTMKIHLKKSCYERLHDIADSICMLLYWKDKKEKEYKKNKRREEIEKQIGEDGLNPFERIEQYRYVNK